MTDQNLTLLEQATRHAAKQALDAVQTGKSGAVGVEVTTDGAVEASADGTFKGGRLTGYARYVFAGARDFVAGLRWSKPLK